MANSVNSCPCGGVDIAICCGPYLAGTAMPPTAEATMRSRYSAFATGNVAHLLRTWHPRTCPDDIGDLDVGKWTGLDVIDVVAGKTGDTTGIVEFIAHHCEGDICERSVFVWRGQRWLYLGAEDPTG
ncbi:MAG: YchJ family protein [Propionibacteriaceae bacterium]